MYECIVMVGNTAKQVLKSECRYFIITECLKLIFSQSAEWVTVEELMVAYSHLIDVLQCCAKYGSYIV